MRQKRHKPAERPSAGHEDQALLQEPSNPALMPALKYLPHATAVLAACIALLTLLGWWLNIPLLQRVLPYSATMKANTALGILACAGSLLLRVTLRQQRTAQILALLLAGFALATSLAAVVEHATGRNLGLNELMFRDAGSQVGTLHPGLMSINSALCLLSTALGLVLFHVAARQAHWPMRVLATIPQLFALLSLAEHVTDSQKLTGVAVYIPMAVHTTVSFLLLSIGLLFSHRDGGLVRIVTTNTVGGALARRLLIAAISMPLLLAALVSAGLRRGAYPWEFAFALLITGVIGLFVLMIWANVRELERIDLARQAAEETRALLDSILATAPVGFSFIDRKLRVRRMNALLADALVVSAEQSQGRPLAEIVPDFAAQQLPLIRDVLETGEPVLHHEEHAWGTIDRGGARFWLSNYYPVRDGRGRIIGVSTLHLDITEQKQHQEERERLLTAETVARSGVELANTRLRALAEATSELSSSLDYETALKNTARSVVESIGDYCIVDVVEANGTIRRVALAAGEPHLDRLLQLAMPYPPTRDGDTPLARVLRTGVPEVMGTITEAWLSSIARTDEHREVLLALRPRSAMIVALEVRGRRLGIMNIVSTNPERSFAQDDLLFAQELARRAAVAIDNAELYRQARDAIQARDDMLAIVSHDLRNPLAAIDTSTAMIIRNTPGGTEGDRLRRHATTIERSSRRMQHLIKDLLEASALESRTLSIAKGAASVHAILQEAAELAEPLARGRGLDLVVDEESPADVSVDCDRERVLQVLSNLLGNACKFTPEGGTIILRALNEPGGIRFEVQDTGPGIREEDLPHLFDRYWKGGATGVKGTGLGLYIAQGVVRLHGSELEVDSHPGQGARFSFTLPIARDATQAPALH